MDWPTGPLQNRDPENMVRYRTRQCNSGALIGPLQNRLYSFAMRSIERAGQGQGQGEWMTAAMDQPEHLAAGADRGKRYT
jgi:hypothetical protein